MPTVDLSTHPVTPSPYGRWQALNAGLGVTAFGINAIVCDPGETIDTEHDETDSGQQEAYIVVAGRAEFTVGSETTEAGPGTVIAVADTSVTRSFRALEPGTRVVCVGAEPAADAPEFGAWISEAAS
jgi:mannose-6-phosphate isomerase-like protein (cupin superfamily)